MLSMIRATRPEINPCEPRPLARRRADNRVWLFGLNPHLGDRRPIDLVRAGRAEELLRALRAERAESFA
jgi:hypothetical protein